MNKLMFLSSRLRYCDADGGIRKLLDSILLTSVSVDESGIMGLRREDVTGQKAAVLCNTKDAVVSFLSFL